MSSHGNREDVRRRLGERYRRLAEARKKSPAAAVAARFTEIDGATLGGIVSVELFTTIIPLIIIGFDFLSGFAQNAMMGHSGSGTKRLGLPKYARVFAAAGLAVLAFDYRRFGSSDGLPRQVIDVAGQREDYRAVVRFARSLDGTDPRRIALWGTSLSGSHVLAVAPFAPCSSPPPRSVM